MYKYLSAFLALCLVVLGGVYAWKQHTNAKREAELSSKLAKLEGVIKETESAYSARGELIEHLQIANKQMQNLIDYRDEKIAALGEAVLKWKGEYFKIKDAKETVTDSDGNPVEDPDTVPPNELRVRVDFSQAKNYLRVHGYTLTNPAYAEVDVEWTRGLKLNFFLTKKGKDFKLYFDTNSPDIIISDLALKVDPSVFERRWYENIGMTATMGIGDGAAGSVALVYDLGKFIIGPHIGFYADSDSNSSGKFYGATITWFWFR